MRVNATTQVIVVALDKPAPVRGSGPPAEVIVVIVPGTAASWATPVDVCAATCNNHECARPHSRCVKSVVVAAVALERWWGGAAKAVRRTAAWSPHWGGMPTPPRWWRPSSSFWATHWACKWSSSLRMHDRHWCAWATQNRLCYRGLHAIWYLCNAGAS